MRNTMTLRGGKPDLASLLGRIRAIAHPPVQITPLPPGIRVEKDVMVPLRDGVHLAVNVYRPEIPGRYPVVMCAHPYGKDQLPRKTPFGYSPPFTYRLMRQTGPVRFSDQTGWEAPDPARWVPRGYVVVNADLRGFFRSEGAPGHLMSDQEAQDYYDLIEWAAAQPWSDGNIGLNGVSYLAIAQWKVAALSPPHLKAICAWEGLSDIYKDLMYPGGIREDGFTALWGRQVKSGVDLRDEQLRRPTRDEWFRSLVPELEKITVPALICGSFSDQSLHTRGSFRAFERISSRYKWLYTHRSGKWATYYGEDALGWQFRFFDCFLKGRDNGMKEVPAVRLAVHDTRTEFVVRAEPAWPLERTRWTALYLDASSGQLRLDEPEASSAASFDAPKGELQFSWAAPWDLELTGPMRLVVYVSVEQTDDLHLFAGVRKIRGGRHVTFEGSYGFAYDLVTKGWLKASLRAVNEELSRPGQPEHDFDAPQPLKPGEVVELQVALLPSATFFKRGDILRLDLRGSWFFAANPLAGAGPSAYQESPPGTCVVHTGAGRRSHLLVPLVAPSDGR